MQDSLYTIYNAILSDHLDAPGNKFPFLVRKMGANVVQATLQLHAKVSQVEKPNCVALASTYQPVFTSGFHADCSQVPLHLQPEGSLQCLPR